MSLKTAVTARAVLLSQEGQMLIVRRSPTDPLHPGTWDIPGGQSEPGEDPMTTAIREAKEEVGLQLSDPKLIFATSDMRGECSKTWVFFAQAVDPKLVVLGDEHDELKWVDPRLLGDYTNYDILLRLRDYLVANGLCEAITS